MRFEACRGDYRRRRSSHPLDTVWYSLCVSSLPVFVSCLARLGEFEPRLNKSFSFSVLTLLVHIALVTAVLMYLWHYHIIDSKLMEYEMDTKLVLAKIAYQTYLSRHLLQNKITKRIKGSNLSPRKQWDNVQQSFDCCGIRDYQDWVSSNENSLQSVPASCGKNETGKKESFRMHVKSEASHQKVERAVIGFLCLTFVVLAIGFAIFLGDADTTEFSLKMDHP